MNKKEIRLNTPELIEEFVNICSGYGCDINLYDEKNILDAKSIIGVFAIAQGKILKVQAITTDENTISRFIKDMRKFEV